VTMRPAKAQADRTTKTTPRRYTRRGFLLEEREMRRSQPDKEYSPLTFDQAPKAGVRITVDAKGRAQSRAGSPSWSSGMARQPRGRLGDACGPRRSGLAFSAAVCGLSAFCRAKQTAGPGSMERAAAVSAPRIGSRPPFSTQLGPARVLSARHRGAMRETTLVRAPTGLPVRDVPPAAHTLSQPRGPREGQPRQGCRRQHTVAVVVTAGRLDQHIANVQHQRL
jgi:hypothetical protein